MSTLKNSIYLLYDKYEILKGRLAPLYPFLGCIGEVIILALFLFGHYFYKREKSNKNDTLKEPKTIQFKKHETETKAE